MPGVTSAWRTNDVVTYDAMRAAATRLTAVLVARARDSGSSAPRAREELSRLRSEVADVDGYDRTAVVELAGRIEARLRELEDRGR